MYCCVVRVAGRCGHFGPPRTSIVLQKSISFLYTDGYGLVKTPHPSSVPTGISVPKPPSVMRTGWYRYMGLGMRGRTDRSGPPKTDRTVVEKSDFSHLSFHAGKLLYSRIFHG